MHQGRVGGAVLGPDLLGIRALELQHGPTSTASEKTHLRRK
jgi:hypothetical protein